MPTTELSNKINNQMLNEIGDYLSGKVTSEQFNLSRLEDGTLLLIYRYGRITYPGKKEQIKNDLKSEITRRSLRLPRYY